MDLNASKTACLAIVLALPTLASAWAQSTYGPWDPSPVGTCSTNFNKALTEERNRNDELVVVREKTKIKAPKEYVWVWDGTPSRNPSRLLYEVQCCRGCVILFMPNADTTDFKLKHDGSLPLTVKSETQPLPNPMGGHASILVTYNFDKTLGRYRKYPSSCERNTESRKTKVDCATAFE